MYIFKNQLEYLRFVIDGQGLRPQESKLEAIKKWDLYLIRETFMFFLGTVGYYQRFIPNFAKKHRASFLSD